MSRKKLALGFILSATVAGDNGITPIKRLQDANRLLRGRYTIMDAGTKGSFEWLETWAIITVLPAYAIAICKEADKINRRLMFNSILKEYHYELTELINHYWNKYEYYRNRKF